MPPTLLRAKSTLVTEQSQKKWATVRNQSPHCKGKTLNGAKGSREKKKNAQSWRPGAACGLTTSRKRLMQKGLQPIAVALSTAAEHRLS